MDIAQSDRKNPLTRLAHLPTMIGTMADLKVRPLDVNAYQEELRVFEQRYRRPSKELAEAFTYNGRLIESADFRRWSFVYSVLNRRGIVY